MQTLLKPHTVQEIIEYNQKHPVKAVKKSIESLIIVESPTKAATLKKFLKDTETLIESTKGHIADLPPRVGKFHLGINTKTFEPYFKVLPDKTALLKDLIKKAAKAKNIYLATDPDREGEAISFHLQNYLSAADANFYRIEFHEITKKAILKALENPSKVNIDLVHAQEARRMIDRIIGYRLSAIVREKLHSRSAGRVQSVVVMLICALEEEIENFKPQDFYTIQLTLKNNLNIELKKIDDESSYLIATQKEADETVSALGTELTLDKINKKEISKKPPLPLITSTLIQKSNSKYRYSARRTMIIAQSLYEGVDIGEEKIGLITYMRTDSRRLSEEFINQAKDYILKNYGEKYLGEYVLKVNANSQDAHEAIRCTNIDLSPEKIKKYLTDEQYNVYELIYLHSIACLFSNSLTAQTTFHFVDDHKKFLFATSASLILFDGYLKFINEIDDASVEKNEQTTYIHHDNPNFDFSQLRLHEKYAISKAYSEHHQTKPPARYTEAKLIKYLEEKGIGRPSTYAEILNRTKDSSYVEVVNNSFIPTTRGKFVNAKLLKSFKEIINSEFTAEMEKHLDEIAEGKIDYQQWTKEFFEKFEPKVEKVLKTMPKEKGIPLHKECPTCHKGNLNIIAGRFGDFIGCDNYPDCKHIEPLHQFESQYIHRQCPECSNNLITKYNPKRQSVFVGCSNYPKCKHAEPLSKAEQKKYLPNQQEDQVTSEIDLHQETKEYSF